MTRAPNNNMTREPPERIELDAANVTTSVELEHTQLVELLAWREVQLTLTTAIFFGVPLLIATVQLVASFLLNKYLGVNAKETWELQVLHYGASVVTTIGVISAILIVFTSLVRVWRSFFAECNAKRPSPTAPHQEARDRQHAESRAQALERKTARLQRLQRARQS